ncbi:hypothetical protein L484_017620 [Morus notabilis]|uniref:Uncharacterized protein n=1 Tax=Morus notabilis TaxID=981085 RepID=W9S8H0_9ROSA|nr:hypothetical protein L484_017620 [Morus notabilis]
MKAAKFVEVLVLDADGCFIISRIFRKEDPIFRLSGMVPLVHHDLILLENQIPRMVLDILFNLTRIPSFN